MVQWNLGGGGGRESKYNEIIYSFPLRFSLRLLYFALLFSLLFLPLFFHVRILSIYQKAPDDNIIPVQREAGLCVWHQPAEGPEEGRTRGALNVRDSGIAVPKEKKSFVLSGWKKKCHFDSSLVLFQPLKNCHSEQQIEVISMIVQQVTVTELTKGVTST